MESQATKPIDGMTAQPLGMELPGMVGFWLACFMFAATNEDCLEQFRADTGYSLESLTRRSALDALIDSATGYEKTVIVAFADWVTRNVWGEEGDEPISQECE